MRCEREKVSRERQDGERVKGMTHQSRGCRRKRRDRKEEVRLALLLCSSIACSSAEGASGSLSS